LAEEDEDEEEEDEEEKEDDANVGGVNDLVEDMVEDGGM